MLNHLKTAQELEKTVGILALIITDFTKDSEGRKRLENANENLLGLADYHRSKAETPDMHMKAEDLLQRISQEMREHVDDMEEAKLPPHLYEGMEALLSEVDAYFVETLETEESRFKTQD